MSNMATPPRRSLPELEAEATQLRAEIDQAEADWKAHWGDKSLTVMSGVDNSIRRLRDKLKVLEMRIAKMAQERG